MESFLLRREQNSSIAFRDGSAKNFRSTIGRLHSDGDHMGILFSIIETSH